MQVRGCHPILVIHETGAPLRLPGSDRHAASREARVTGQAGPHLTSGTI